MGVDNDFGVRVVLQALRHLLAILREYKAVDDYVLEGGLVEEGRAEHHERVKPACQGGKI